MDEWESVRQKIKELEGSFLNASPEVRNTLETVSVADFWKRRYEEEKQLWEEKLAQKEHEQAQIREKFDEDEQGIRELGYKVQLLEQRLEAERGLWEERSKIKLLEAEMEKKRAEWEGKLAILEEENQGLRAQLRKGAEHADEGSRQRQELEAERARMAEEMRTLQKQIELLAAEEQQKIRQFEQEKQTVQKQLDDMLAAQAEAKAKSAAVERELALLGEERDRHLSQLAEREKSQFASFEDLVRGFTHKVRNYLGIVSGTLQLSLADPNLQEPLKEKIATADRNVQEMLKAMEEFLALAKIPDLAPQPADPNEFLARAIAAVEEEAKARNVALERRFGESLPVMEWDAKLLGEGFRQILLNAVEASAAGSAVTVQTSFESGRRTLVIRISDGGPGIPENHLKKVFQPYFTTKKGRKGLGMSLAKRAVDLHHGSLLISSARDQGTTVVIQLPVRKAAG